jgi:perosamine synthetase
MIPLAEPVIGAAERRALAECAASGFVSSVGPLVGAFEKRFAETVGARYAIATASGTAALHASLTALGIERGMRVAVPDLTFVATANPVLYCGAKPVLVDVSPHNWCLDPAALWQACRKISGIRATIPVHLYGNACNMDEIRCVARKFNLLVVEDATEALGTYLKGRQTGTFGNLGCFSFNGNKLITTGTGGMVVTDSRDLAERVRHLVNQARIDPRYYRHDTAGFNYRMTNMSAALGLAQLDRLDGILEARRRTAQHYAAGLGNAPGVTLHPEQPDVRNSFWLYSILVDTPAHRTVLLDSLQAAGITPRPFFTPLHSQPYLRAPVWRASGPDRTGRSTVSTRLADCGINLPSSYSLTRRQQEQVIAAIKASLATS